MTVKRITTAIGNNILHFIDRRRKEKYINFLLKCPLCKSKDVHYFRPVMTNMTLLKKLSTIMNHEYVCHDCKSFIPHHKLIKLELQKGDEGFMDYSEMIAKEKEERRKKEETRKLQRSINVLNDIKTKIAKKVIIKKPKLKIDVPILKKEKHIKKMEKDIEKFDEKDFDNPYR